MSCKEDTCGGKKMNARCVDYEGKVSKCSGTEDKCKKRTVHEVLEDNSQHLTEICRQLDMSDLTPGCLEVEVSKPEVKDYMQAIIDKLCDSKFDCEKLFNTSLECSGLDYKCFVNECEEEFKPSNLTELFQMLIDRSCNNGEVEYNDLYLNLRPQESETYIKYPEVVVTGGTAPYAYKWTLQQTGGTVAEITNSTTNDYFTMIGSLDNGSRSCGIEHMIDGQPPCRISLANGSVDQTFAWHFKLEVTDSKGKKVRDYWTQYMVSTQ